jgi:hypothetical protein
MLAAASGLRAPKVKMLHNLVLRDLIFIDLLVLLGVMVTFMLYLPV